MPACSMSGRRWRTSASPKRRARPGWTPAGDAARVPLGRLRTWAALAAMIFAGPDFLLLDEPTDNLDRKGRAAAE